MRVNETGFEGLIVLEPDVHVDSRGYFFESYNRMAFQEAGITFNCVQLNQSQSRKNVIRGLHYQRFQYAQAKLIRVLAGTILDVVVDMRKEQKTFGHVFSIELSSKEKRQLLVPKGFAHGFSVLSDMAEIIYACDEFHDPGAQAGILHSDPALSIDWRVKPADRIVSDKDLALPLLTVAEY